MGHSACTKMRSSRKCLGKDVALLTHTHSRETFILGGKQATLLCMLVHRGHKVCSPENLLETLPRPFVISLPVSGKL